MYLFHVATFYLLAQASGQQDYLSPFESFGWRSPFESFTWFHDSKEFCLTLRRQQSVIAKDSTLTLGYGSKSATVKLGTHACHNGTHLLDMCGYLPEDVDETVQLTIIHVAANMHWVDPDFADVKGVQRYHQSLQELGSFEGKSSPVSLGDKCLLYKSKCSKCHQTCSAVRQGKSELSCNGHMISGDDVFLRRVGLGEDLSYQVNVESVVDITNRNILCVTLKRPSHELGNIWRNVKYVPAHLETVYSDENDERHILNSFQADICSDIYPMVMKNETTTFCTKYVIKPKTVIRIQGAIEIEGYNQVDKKYTAIQERGFRRTFRTNPAQVVQVDVCSVQNVCDKEECQQSCHLMVTNNSYVCNGIVHPSPANALTTVVPIVPSTTSLSSEMTTLQDITSTSESEALTTTKEEKQQEIAFEPSTILTTLPEETTTKDTQPSTLKEQDDLSTQHISASPIPKDRSTVLPGPTTATNAQTSTSSSAEISTSRQTTSDYQTEQYSSLPSHTVKLSKISTTHSPRLTSVYSFISSEPSQLLADITTDDAADDTTQEMINSTSQHQMHLTYFGNASNHLSLNVCLLFLVVLCCENMQ